jgi:hypothetical protein
LNETGTHPVISFPISAIMLAEAGVEAQRIPVGTSLSLPLHYLLLPPTGNGQTQQWRPLSAFITAITGI